ncbi:MAG: Nif3-like dinuclear metal center hexameric protein [Bacteroidia bacterium]|nr:Nif3-like dinuclear metal center hexameric protein [Bacteroidia bacterium]MDW8014916.1 Nif3-like dinuclear metal center hexameric protein [Bacteroidia bacterium]
MISLQTVIEALERWVPSHWAESYDTVGLLWGDPTQSLTGILTTLDITPELIDEAQAVGANLLIAHHPIWFGQKQRLSWDNFADQVIQRLIRADIAVYALHTNLDQAREGVSYVLCQVVGLTPRSFLQGEGEYGMGYIGEGAIPLPPEDFLNHLKRSLQIPVLRYARGPQTAIQRVAVCGGAGSFLLPQAIKAKVDAFVTADIPYHRFFEARGKLWLIDIGHYESEVWISDQIARYLHGLFPDLPIFSTRLRTNPIDYWI